MHWKQKVLFNQSNRDKNQLSFMKTLSIQSRVLVTKIGAYLTVFGLDLTMNAI